MKELFLIRGLPGSGKTTFAHKITDHVCEADQFFAQSGEYKWDREQLPHAHNWCRKRVQHLMNFGVSTIAVANTFVTRDTMDPYIAIAKVYGYTVTEITMSGPLRESIHNVPAENIDRMNQQWEK